MKRFSSACRWLLVLSVVVATGCVDDSFRIDKVSTEVTIGQGATLPLGDLERKTLGDLLAEAEGIDTLITKNDGGYVLGVSGDGEYTIGGIKHIVQIPAVKGEFKVDYPEFGLTDHAHKVDEYCDIESNYGSLSILEGETVSVPEGLKVTGREDGDLIEAFDYEVPEMISGIKRIYLKPTEEGDPGARVDVRFLLNDLASINGGGHVNLELKAPEGCNIYDADGRHVEDGEFAVNEFDFTADQDELPFLIYIESIANNSPVENGKIGFSVDLEYHVSFEMTTKSGSLNLIQGPQLHIMSDLAYEDADVVLNEVAILDHMKPENGDVVIKDLPEEITLIRSLTFAEESPLTLKAGGFEWMSEDLAEKIIIDAWLPEYIILHENVEIGYNAEEHKLHTTLNSLRNGVEVDLDALDFGAEGLDPKNGEVKISFAPEIDARIEEGTEVKLSSVMHEGEMTLNAGIEEATLDIQEVCGYVNYEYTYEKRIGLGGVDNLSIDGVGLTPVLKLELENPFTMELMASYSIVPYVDGKIQADRAINTNGYNGVGYVTIPAAAFKDGVVEPSRSVIVLGTEASREEYSAEGYIFVPCDIDKLLTGQLPDELDLRLNISTDLFKEVALHALDNYVLKYDYSLELPIELNAQTGVTYEQTVDFTKMKGGNPFEQLAELDYIKVGDVAVLADVTTTLPLELVASADMLDADGKVIEGLIVLPEDGNSIVGSKDGVAEATSTLRLELHLVDDGCIAQLSNVAAISFRLHAMGIDDSSVALSDEQYVEAELTLELAGGVTADLKALENM